MDNLTHSLVGLGVGELVHRSLPRERDGGNHRLRRRLLLVSCAIASNLPDIDLLWTHLLPAPLGALLHHRGYTHTALFAVLQAIALWLLLRLCWPAARKLLDRSHYARVGTAVAIAIGLALHLAMDYLNSYGIHPFHPFDSRWFYGDMVFIVEPVFWITFGVTMAMTVERRAMRFLLLALLAGAPLFFTLKGYLAWGSLAFLWLAAAGLAVLQHRAGESGRAALIAALALALSFIAVQGVASHRAAQIAAEAVRKADPAGRMLDAAMSPYPTNPLCWTFVSIEENERAKLYRLHRGVLSLAPDIEPASACPAAFSRGPFSTGATPAVAFQSEEDGRLDTLRELARTDCHFKAWLRFARMPLVRGNAASDLRFGSPSTPNFTRFDFSAFAGRDCPRFVPQWGIPRSDLLGPESK